LTVYIVSEYGEMVVKARLLGGISAAMETLGDIPPPNKMRAPLMRAPDHPMAPSASIRKWC
jgi:hypothetical protein